MAAGPALLRAARTGDARVREQAMKALAVIQPPDAAEAFAAGLKDPSAEVRLVASAGWVKAPAVAAGFAAALVEALRDPEARVRANAARALSRLADLPAEAIPPLAECVQDPSDSVRLNAALALRKAPPTATADALEALLDDPNGRVRLIAAGSVLAADGGMPGRGRSLKRDGRIGHRSSGGRPANSSPRLPIPARRHRAPSPTSCSPRSRRSRAYGRPAGSSRSPSVRQRSRRSEAAVSGNLPPPGIGPCAEQLGEGRPHGRGCCGVGRPHGYPNTPGGPSPQGLVAWGVAIPHLIELLP